MSSVIHMDTETVTEISLKFRELANENHELIENTRKLIVQNPWSENICDGLVTECSALLNTLKEQNIAGDLLFVRLLRERDEWLALDQFGKLQYEHMRTRLIDDPAGGGFIGYLADGLQQWLANKNAKDKLNAYWETLKTREQRMAFLQDYYEKLANELGLEPVLFGTGDIGGSKGRYYSDGKTLVLSENDFLNRSPFDLLETIAHETRHQYQHQCVQYYDINGKPPEGMSEDLIKAWKENQLHPIDSDKDFWGYRAQQDEADSRDFGSNYATEYLLANYSGN